MCECDKGWLGTDCGIQRPFWNAWGPWGKCEPECGNPRHRKRKRTCSTARKPCIGDPEDFMNCAPRICVSDGKTQCEKLSSKSGRHASFCQSLEFDSFQIKTPSKYC